MENQLVSIETAKLAKKKGFLENTLYYTSEQVYNRRATETDYIWYSGNSKGEPYGYNIFKEERIHLPTQSFLQSWLREKHNIIVSIIPHFYGSYSSPTVKYRYKIMTHEDITEFDSYEECLEIGLQEGLSEIKTPLL